MRRREFVTLIGSAAAWPFTTQGQQAGKIYRIGLLSGGSPTGPLDERNKSFTLVLAQRGYVEGRNVVIEQRWANGRVELLDALAAELKADKVDVIVAFGYPAALAAKVSANKTPTVISGAGDPVATGLVDGLARPGGYLTGVTELSTDLSAKRLEILKDAVPGLGVVAMLWNAADLGMTLRYRAAEDAARVLGVKVQTLGVREPNDFEQAFAEMTRQRPDAILMVSDALTLLNRKRVVEFAAANRLPTIFENASPVREGGLMSYGPNQSAIGERVAELVARVLGGARPADLPLELPTRFELIINLKTAKALGLNLLPALLDRADEVIE
ncbi:MAG TPA: ABC transporter substrate-binding protein [Pseudolabrys sp.]|jgi:putative ABC transport system substrate-binding protein|nr:ABC transporter substrate-binding protein [Pseudolabrys sp.]